MGAEVRSLLPTEQLEEIHGRLAVTDENPHKPGTRSVRFWVDEAPSSPEGSRSHGDEEHANPLAIARDVNRAPMTPERRERVSPVQETLDRNHSRGSPDFGGGVGYHEDDGHHRGHIPTHSRKPPSIHQKIRFLEAVPCIQWNRYENGSARVRI